MGETMVGEVVVVVVVGMKEGEEVLWKAWDGILNILLILIIVSRKILLHRDILRSRDITITIPLDAMNRGGETATITIMMILDDMTPHGEVEAAVAAVVVATKRAKIKDSTTAEEE